MENACAVVMRNENTGPAERFSKWGGGGGGAQWRNEPKYFFFARERSDRGVGASIHFWDWGGGQKVRQITLCARCAPKNY